MGRPRKSKEDTLTFKEQQMEVAEFKEVIQAQEAQIVYNRVALGIRTNPKTLLEEVVEIQYNDSGSISDTLKVVSEGDGFGYAIEKFKIEAQAKILERKDK